MKYVNHWTVGRVGRQVYTSFIINTRGQARYSSISQVKEKEDKYSSTICLLPVPGCPITFLETPRINVLRCKGTQRTADLFSLSRSAVPAAIFFTGPDWTGLCLKLIKRCTTRRAKIFLKENFAPIFTVMKTARLFRVTLDNNKWGTVARDVRLADSQNFRNQTENVS